LRPLRSYFAEFAVKFFLAFFVKGEKPELKKNKINKTNNHQQWGT